MKKLVLSACVCFTGLSAMDNYKPHDLSPSYPHIEWEYEPNDELAREAAKDFFFKGPFTNKAWHMKGFEPKEIQIAMQRFPDFLTWRFKNNGTILHLLAVREGCWRALEAILELSPPDLDINVMDAFGKKPEYYAPKIFERYKDKFR